MTNNALTPAQVQQLVDAAAKNPLDAHLALKYSPKFTEKQQQQLVDRIAKNSQIASFALKDISWLTDVQKTKLHAVA